jgi:hypothetical protein
MDMGIIANLKTNYKNYLSNDKNNFSINILDAIINLKKSWDDVSQTTIKNCFNKAQFKKDKTIDSVENDKTSDSVNIIAIEDHQDQLPTFDDDHVPICADTDSIIEETEESSSDEETENEYPIRDIDSKTAMIHFQELQKFLLNNNANCMKVHEFKLESYHAIDNSKKQTKITDFFKN